MHDIHRSSHTPLPLAARPAAGRLVVVTGPRGAPGRTEVAYALAAAPDRHRCAVIDLDFDAPGLAVRAGVSPRPDLADAAAALADTGCLPRGAVRRVGGVGLVAGSHRPVPQGVGRLVAEAVLRTVPLVIADAGPVGVDNPLLARANRIVVVVEGSPNGIVRAAEFLSGWHLRPPELVVNRVRPADRDDVVRAVRRWTGLEPSAVVPERAAIRLASRRAGPPDPALIRSLIRLFPKGTPMPPRRWMIPVP